MKARTWGRVDPVAHMLHGPVQGRTGHRRVRLIPERLLCFVCDRYDLALGLTEDEVDQGAP